MTLETRKIQKVGTSTLTISLPRGWVEDQKVQKGDQVFLAREGDVLKVLPPALVQRQERQVEEYIVDADACDDTGMLERIIVGNYVLGRERIIVRSGRRLEGRQLEEIRATVKHLMGIGIIDETTNRAVLQCSLDPLQYPMESLVKRLYNLALTMTQEAVEGLLTKDPALAEEAMKREEDADMIYWLIVRHVLSAQQDEGLAEKLGMENKLNNAGYRVIAKELEAAADEAASMANAVRELLERNAALDGGFLRALREFSHRVEALLTNSIAALLTRDLRLANQTLEARKGLKSEEEKLWTVLGGRGGDPGVILRLRTIVDALSRTATISTSLANIAFNRYLERSTPICRLQVSKR